MDWLSGGTIEFRSVGTVYDTLHFPDGFEISDVDRAMLERREIRDYLAAGFAEALRQGGAGPAHEILINHGRPWGFALEELGIAARHTTKGLW